MRIISADGEFNMPDEFKTQLVKTNVFITDDAELSNTITLPPTQNNLRLIYYSNRLDNKYKPVSDIDVIVIDGIDVTKCLLNVINSDEEDGIQCTLYFSSSQFYSRTDGVKLSSLTWPTVKSPNYASETLSQRVSWLVDLLTEEFKNPSSDYFFVAPLKTAETFQYSVGGAVETRNFYLNGFHRWNILDFSGDPGIELNVLEGSSSHVLVIDGANVSVTKGYGMTVFLKLQYVLEHIFETYGYSLVNNFRPTWQITCVINTVADAIYAGVLKFGQLLPETTIKDFLTQIEDTYAGRFLFNNVNNTVSFITFKHVFQETPVNLTQYLSTRPRKGEANFCVVSIVDSRYSESNQVEDTELENETITINSLTTMLDLQSNSEVFKMYGPVSNIEIFFKCIKTDSKIVHKNSSVIIDGKLTSDEEAATSKVQLAEFMSDWVNADYRTSPQVNGLYIYYKHAYELLHEASQDEFTDLREIFDWYYEYVYFKRNSNIPVSCKMRMPEHVFHSINKNVRIILNSTIFVIESIKYQTDRVDGYVDCDMSLRTFTEYRPR